MRPKFPSIKMISYETLFSIDRFPLVGQKGLQGGQPTHGVMDERLFGDWIQGGAVNSLYPHWIARNNWLQCKVVSGGLRSQIPCQGEYAVSERRIRPASAFQKGQEYEAQLISRIHISKSTLSKFKFFWLFLTDINALEEAIFPKSDPP